MSNKDFHAIFFGATSSERNKFASALGTSVGYLERIAGGFALPSTRMLVKLARLDSRITLASILPRFEEKNGAVE